VASRGQKAFIIVFSNILIVLACVGSSVLFLYLAARPSSTHFRRESNDFTGAVVAVIGTTYAVILAFTLSGVWSMFQGAQTNEEQEANALVNVYRIATQMQDSNATQIQELCARYVDNALNREWSVMERDKQLTPEGAAIIDQLWTLAGQSQARNQPDTIAAYQLMEELRGLTQYRRIRAMQSREHLPGILWTVLVAGGIITVAVACFFGVTNFRFHLLQVLVLSLLISLVLVAIADIDRPYQGIVKVAPEGFMFARHTVQHRSAP